MLCNLKQNYMGKLDINLFPFLLRYVQVVFGKSEVHLNEKEFSLLLEWLIS